MTRRVGPTMLTCQMTRRWHGMSAAQIQSQIQLHVGSATLDPIPQLAAWLQLSSRLMTRRVGPTMLTCQMTGRWHGMSAVHADVTITSGWRHPCHATVHVDATITWWWRHNYPGQSHRSGQLVFGSGRVSPSGQRRRVARVGRRLTGAWWLVRPFSMSDFDAVFTSGFVSSSSTQWYGQNTILTTLIFEQKSNTTLNHMLWYQL
jgi:hypothetical protein